MTEEQFENAVLTLRYQNFLTFDKSQAADWKVSNETDKECERRS